MDEHVDRGIAAIFREMGFRVREAARDRRLHGRDERDYMAELIADREVFVTRDRCFISDLLEGRWTGRHSGVAYVGDLPPEHELIWALTGRVAGQLREGGMRGVVMEALPAVGVKTTYQRGGSWILNVVQLELSVSEYLGRPELINRGEGCSRRRRSPQAVLRACLSEAGSAGLGNGD